MEAGVGRFGLFVLVAAVITAPDVRAQQTTAELESMKATKPSKEDLQTLLSGASIEYVSARNIKYRYDQKANGSLVGFASGFSFADNANAPGAGTWRVDENGRYCITSTWGHSRPYDNNWCAVVYKLGDDYYITYATRPDAKPIKLIVSK
jgi:hypothetical protein